ncbi:MAG: ABC transporter ATP-binding protein [Desulfobacterales bacterium]|jgi:iron complex transport system ATP-binding protein|nr:ABC transporter ATP-binding protein [Desulfobacterales bacterium]
MKKAIHIEHLFRTYNGTSILKDISFQVLPGEFFIIIGPNGSGKTTLLKTLAGIDLPQGGRVNVFDRALERYSRKDLAKTLSFVPQNMPLDFPFTVAQTVLMGRYPHLGVLGFEGEADIQIAQRAIEFTGVTHLSGRKVDQLSGGERQCVFIARALCQEPRLLLLDEPTASLDLAHQVRVMDLMARLKRETGMTVVMVSHDVNLAAMYADRLLLLKSGQIAALGAPRQVMTFETLESVYGCPLLVDESPLDGLPRITLVPSRFLSVRDNKE